MATHAQVAMRITLAYGRQHFHYGSCLMEV